MTLTLEIFDLNIYVNLPIAVLYQNEYVRETELRCLRQGFAHRCESTYEQEKGFNGMMSREYL